MRRDSSPTRRRPTCSTDCAKPLRCCLREGWRRCSPVTRAAVAHWGLEVLCLEPAEYSPVLTAVLMPPGHDADKFRKTVLDTYNMSLGSGLSALAGKVFRIGPLGDGNA